MREEMDRSDVRGRNGVVLGFEDRLRGFVLRVRSNERRCSCGGDGRDLRCLFSSRRLRA